MKCGKSNSIGLTVVTIFVVLLNIPPGWHVSPNMSWQRLQERGCAIFGLLTISCLMYILPSLVFIMFLYIIILWENSFLNFSIQWLYIITTMLIREYPKLIHTSFQYKYNGLMFFCSLIITRSFFKKYGIEQMGTNIVW